MNEHYLCQDGETNQYSIVLMIGTKDRDRAIQRGDEMLNDLLSACTFALREYDRVSKTENPNFRASLKRIEKQLWRCLK